MQKLSFVTVTLVVISVGAPAQQAARPFVAHFVEGCSCSVPCACNFGGMAIPSPVCQSLAVFQFEGGDHQVSSLVGKRLGIENRAGERGIIIVEPFTSGEVRARLEELGALILGQDGTYVHSTVQSMIGMAVYRAGFDALMPGHGELHATYLRGSSATHRIKVFNPIVFGELPVSFVYKATTGTLTGKDLTFQFEGTNANEGYVRLDKLVPSNHERSQHP